MSRIPLNDRKELIKLRNAGLSNREIGRRLKCVKKTVRITLQKHQKTITVRDDSRYGRDRAISYKEYRAIKIRSLRKRLETSSQIQKLCDFVENCSLSTIKNRIKEFKLRSCIARCKPIIFVKNRKRRIDFVRFHEDHDASYCGEWFLAMKASKIG